MRLKAALLKFVIGELFADQTQSLLLALEEKIMSAITADLTDIKTKLGALKQTDADITAQLADVSAKLDAANAALANAQAIDPADAQLIADIKALLA